MRPRIDAVPPSRYPAYSYDVVASRITTHKLDKLTSCDPGLGGGGASSTPNSSSLVLMAEEEGSVMEFQRSD